MDSLASNKWSLWLLAFVCLFCSGCREEKKGKEEKPISDTRSLPPFEQLVLNGMGKVRLSPGTEEKIVIHTDSKLLSFLSTSVKEGQLLLEWLPTTAGEYSRDVVYDVTFKKLTSIRLAGQGEIKGDTPWDVEELKISLAGNGEIELELKGKIVDVEIGGRGAVVLSGEVEKQAISLNGFGSYDGSELSSESAYVSIAGVGDAMVDASSSLTVEIAGMGSLGYKGAPSIEKHISGIGRLYQFESGE